MRRHFSKYIAIIALLPVFLTFQNCSGNFQAGSEEQLSLAAIVPQITLTQRPDDLTNLRSPGFAFNIVSNAIARMSHASCTLDEMQPKDCVDQVMLMDLADGDHSFGIKAIDSLGNASEELVVRFRVDGTSPTITINSGPMDLTGANSAAIAFMATDNLSGVAATECAFDGAPFAVCMSPQNFVNLTEGTHSLKIRAKDFAGNISSEAIRTWKIDLSAPIVTILTGPMAVAKSRLAAFNFTGVDDGVSLTDFLCSVDGGAADPCTSPINYANFADGSHTFSVKAKDAVGNISAAATYNWLVDLALPVSTITSGPDASTSATIANFVFSANDGTVGSGIEKYECSLDNSAFSACASVQGYSGLAAGPHSFNLRAVDKAGNVGMLATHNWTIVPPP